MNLKKLRSDFLLLLFKKDRRSWTSQPTLAVRLSSVNTSFAFLQFCDSCVLPETHPHEINFNQHQGASRSGKGRGGPCEALSIIHQLNKWSHRPLIVLLPLSVLSAQTEHKARGPGGTDNNDPADPYHLRVLQPGPRIYSINYIQYN